MKNLNSEKFIKYQVLSQYASKPVRAHALDAGLDLYTPLEVTVEPKSFKCLGLGIAIEVPNDCVGLVEGRSGLASKNGFDTIGNVIDAGYTGEIHVTLVNNSNEAVTFHSGQKVAQLLILPIIRLEAIKVNQLDSLSDRQTNGLGSTGL